mgnify:CR=1 FL=1
MADGEIDVAYLSAEGKRRLRWQYISYVPQGSMSVLNPVAKLKDTYRDFIESHVGGSRRGLGSQRSSGVHGRHSGRS